MKKIIKIFIILITFQSYSQSVLFDFSKKEYIPAALVLENGNTLSGFITDFMLPKTVEFRGVGFEFKSIESKLRMDNPNIKFKSTTDGEVQKMELKDIKSITLLREEAVIYEKIKLKTINSNNEVVDLEREVIVPLIKAGALDLYGLKAYNCSNGSNCEMIYVIAYIKNPNQDYAYIPIDVNRINLFNTGSLTDKLFKSFAEAGSDCPEFLAYLDAAKNEIIDKDTRQKGREAYKQFRKEKKEKLKAYKAGRERRNAEDDLDVAYFLSLYYNLIDEYASRCD